MSGELRDDRVRCRLGVPAAEGNSWYWCVICGYCAEIPTFVHRNQGPFDGRWAVPAWAEMPCPLVHGLDYGNMTLMRLKPDELPPI